MNPALDIVVVELTDGLFCFHLACSEKDLVARLTCGDNDNDVVDASKKHLISARRRLGHLLGSFMDAQTEDRLSLS